MMANVRRRPTSRAISECAADALADDWSGVADSGEELTSSVYRERQWPAYLRPIPLATVAAATAPATYHAIVINWLARCWARGSLSSPSAGGTVIALTP